MKTEWMTDVGGCGLEKVCEGYLSILSIISLSVGLITDIRSVPFQCVVLNRSGSLSDWC